LKIFDRDVKLRKKKDLIKKFIEENLPKIGKADSVEEAFSDFWESERSIVLKKLAKDESIPTEKIEHLIGEYLYTQKLPHEQAIADLLPVQPRILEREGVIERIRKAIESIVDVFLW